MSLVRWYLERRRENRLLELIRESNMKPMKEGLPIRTFVHGEVVGVVWAEFHDSRTQIRVRLNRVEQKNGRKRKHPSFRSEDLLDVYRAAASCYAYIERVNL